MLLHHQCKFHEDKKLEPQRSVDSSVADDFKSVRRISEGEAQGKNMLHQSSKGDHVERYRTPEEFDNFIWCSLMLCQTAIWSYLRSNDERVIIQLTTKNLSFKKKKATLSGSGVTNVRICWFTSSQIKYFWGFRLLVQQNQQPEDVPLKTGTFSLLSTFNSQLNNP